MIVVSTQIVVIVHGKQNKRIFNCVLKLCISSMFHIVDYFVLPLLFKSLNVNFEMTYYKPNIYESMYKIGW